ncbi:4,5-DOPA dioxygenase extradiol [Runella sp. CRIBMP]|nr:4,5-DOPA dioxygenase extradiol [Runella sp. CRIBMP]
MYLHIFIVELILHRKMKRNEFIKSALGGAIAMESLKDLYKWNEQLAVKDSLMPMLFVGHGSPMNGIENNEFSQNWKKFGTEISVPTAVLVVSAHWYIPSTKVTAMNAPRTIHDFGGFPKALFDVRYPVPGSPALAQETASLIHKTKVGLDHEWGLDHGTWTVVRHMYPKANIPVLQLSIDYTKPPRYHYELAKELAALRKKGVLIIGSGNMVHNLRIIDWHLRDKGYDWAIEMNETFKSLIIRNEHEALINYERLGQAGKLSIPTPEHYLPLLYILGLKEEKDKVSFFNDKTMLGAISMTSVKVG